MWRVLVLTWGALLARTVSLHPDTLTFACMCCTTVPKAIANGNHATVCLRAARGVVITRGAPQMLLWASRSALGHVSWCQLSHACVVSSLALSSKVWSLIGL